MSDRRTTAAESKVTIELGKGSGGLETARSIASGQPPSNATILESLDSAKHSVSSQKASMDPQGRKIGTDVEQVIEATRNIITEKNSDQKFQEMIMHTKESAAHGGAAIGNAASASSASSSTPGASTVASDVVTISREVALILVQNRDLRNLAVNQLQLLQRLFWNRLKNTSPSSSSSIPPVSAPLSSERSIGGDHLATGAYYSYDTGFTNNPIPGSTAYTTSNVYNTFSGQTQQQPISGQPAAFGAAPSSNLSRGNAVGSLGEANLSSLSGQPSTFGGQPSTFGQPTQGFTTLGSTTAPFGTTDSFQNINLTPEERRELVDSWRNFFCRLGDKPNYRNCVEGMYSLFHHLSSIKQTSASEINQPHNQGHVQKSKVEGKETAYEAREIIERFTGEKSLDRIIQLVRDLVNYVSNQPELQRFFHDWGVFSKNIMENPKLMQQDSYGTQLENLVDRSVYWMNVPYFRTQTKAVADELKDLADRFTSDETISDFTDSWSKLFRDLAMDSNGNPSISQLTNSIPQLKNILAPILIEQFNYIPINRIYGTTPKYDFELSNIVLCASDLVPERFFFEMKSKADVGLSANSTDELKSRLKLKISNITASMKSVHFYYLRKRMPKIEDEGVADFLLLQPGAKIKLVWEVVTRTNKPLTFRFRNATCTVNNVKINVIKAKHNIIDRIATKLFAGTFRSRFETAVSDGLTSMGQMLTDRMNAAIRGKSTSSIKSGSSSLTGSNTVRSDVKRDSDDVKRAELHRGEDVRSDVKTTVPSTTTTRSADVIKPVVHQTTTTSTTGRSEAIGGTLDQNIHRRDVVAPVVPVASTTTTTSSHTTGIPATSGLTHTTGIPAATTTTHTTGIPATTGLTTGAIPAVATTQHGVAATEAREIIGDKWDRKGTADVNLPKHSLVSGPETVTTTSTSNVVPGENLPRRA